MEAATTTTEPTGEQGDPYADPNCWGFNDEANCVAFISSFTSEYIDDPGYRATDECVRWLEPTAEIAWGPTEECDAWLFEPHTEY